VIEDESTYKDMITQYIEQPDGNLYRNLTYTRHYLRKNLLFAFIGLTIYWEVKKACRKDEKLEKVKHLKQLLLDTTNVLLNYDVPSHPIEDDYDEIGLPTPPLNT
jgi:hypothetical protein